MNPNTPARVRHRANLCMLVLIAALALGGAGMVDWVPDWYLWIQWALIAIALATLVYNQIQLYRWKRR